MEQTPILSHYIPKEWRAIDIEKRDASIVRFDGLADSIQKAFIESHDMSQDKAEIIAEQGVGIVWVIFWLYLYFWFWHDRKACSWKWEVGLYPKGTCVQRRGNTRGMSTDRGRTGGEGGNVLSFYRPNRSRNVIRLSRSRWHFWIQEKRGTDYRGQLKLPYLWLNVPQLFLLCVFFCFFFHLQINMKLNSLVYWCLDSEKSILSCVLMKWSSLLITQKETR